ncbi:hypothetical protein [Paenibacillus polymyxa]|uniref:hypothetical protein n=1 Tax=Paenibacillus polymyxa TaxID=1406 RepID=UPI000C9F1F56|nr:hypothetical protein [Paenibacillus polymyxa]PNQ84644.1 hypothetical protein C1T20_16220 [Paenibacillus polymyxa]
MASEKTPNLGLNQIDRTSPKTTYFDLEKYLDENWRSVDKFAGDVNDGVNEIKKRLDTAERKAVTLEPGVQIVHAEKAAPFSLTGLSGRTLVNLLGRMGSCETVSEWSSNVAIAIDNNNKTNGSSSFKITLGGVPATASASFLTTPGRKYIAIADVKSGNTIKVAISINGIASAVGNDVNSGSVFAPSVVRFTAKEYFHIVTITGTGATGNTFNMDSVRVYEISDVDYAAAASLTPVQAAAKWAYVDSVMPVRNPYAIRYGENLLPSFYEWSVNTTGIVTFQGPYKAAATRSVPDVISPLRVVVPVLPNTTYIISSIGDGLQYIERKDDNDSDPNGEVMPGVVVVGTKTFTTSTQTRFLSVRLRYASTGSFTHEYPMLNIGGTVKPFKPREDSMLALQTDLYADPVTGANADTVFEHDGQYFKSKKWQGLTLDGSRAWALGEGGATNGNRQVKVSGLATGAVAGSGRGTKFDGKILPQGSTGNTPDTNAVNAAGDVYIAIPAVDSGWADGFTPTQDEIKAYFLGWNMYYWNGTSAELYNNQGPKSWRKINNHGATTSTLPTTQIDPGLSKDGRFVYWEPYKLVYQLVTPTVESIVTEGQLTFNEGDNQIEVGTGIVVREPNRTYQEAAGGWNINNGTTGWEPSLLKYKASAISAVYKNNKKDGMWTIDNTRPTVAGALAQQLNVNHDLAAAYSVTYLMLDRSPVVSFTGVYAANEKTLLADLVDSVQQNTARVSVLENKKADKDNPVWLTPTLQNGWQNFDPVRRPLSYFKDSQGWVYVQGYIKGGATTPGSVIFSFPEGYKPENPVEVNAVSNNGTGSVPSTLYVGANNLQCNADVRNANLVVDFSYRAKQ